MSRKRRESTFLVLLDSSARAGIERHRIAHVSGSVSMELRYGRIFPLSHGIRISVRPHELQGAILTFCKESFFRRRFSMKEKCIARAVKTADSICVRALATALVDELCDYKVASVKACKRACCLIALFFKKPHFKALFLRVFSSLFFIENLRRV